jgi:hypothetical protein
MQFLKHHYEKLLLGLVLAGMVGVLVFMIFYVGADKQAMEEQASHLVDAPGKPLPDLDLSANQAVAQRAAAPPALDFESGHKVFNPLEWQRNLDNQLIRRNTSTGIQVAVVTNITPLYLVLTLDAVSTNELGARYVIGIERQAAPTPAKRRKQQRYVSAGDKPNDVFTLAEVKGTPGSPDSLTLKLADTGELASVAAAKPFRRVDAYVAALRYDPEKTGFRGLRAGGKVTLAGTDYQVADIGESQVTFQDLSNQKKFVLPLK